MYSSKYLAWATLSLLTCASGYVGPSQASQAGFDPLNATGEGCVDPKGFRGLVQENLATFVSCGERCKQKEVAGMRSYTECLSGCKDNQYMNTIESWVESCWNQVFSCEYQKTAIIYLHRTSTRNTISGGIPFYPPPPGEGLGSCSCNLGWVEGNQTRAESDFLPYSFGGGSNSAEESGEIMCCATSSALSVQNICPDSDLSFFATGSEGEGNKTISNLEELSPDKCAIIDKSPGDCQTKYNFTSAGVALINPFNPPPEGKEPLSNGAGNAFTDGSNQVVTVQFEGLYTPKTITLASWKDAGVATATGTAKATGTGTQAGTTGAGAASPSNAAGIVGAPSMRWVGGFAVLLFGGMW